MTRFILTILLMGSPIALTAWLFDLMLEDVLVSLVFAGVVGVLVGPVLAETFLADDGAAARGRGR